MESIGRIKESSLEAYIPEFTEIEFPIDEDSFLHNKFIGDESDRFSPSGNPRRFIMQFKHPVSGKYYRLYISDKDLYEKEATLPNGQSILVRKYDTKPTLNIIADHQEDKEYDMDIVPGSISFRKYNFLTRDVQDKLGISDDELDSLSEEGFIGQSFIVERSIFGGEPFWLQEEDIPAGFEKSDFLCQICSIFEHGVMFADMGIIYIYEKNGEFGVTWQMS